MVSRAGMTLPATSGRSRIPTKLPLTLIFGLTPRGATATMLRGFLLFLIERTIQLG